MIVNVNMQALNGNRMLGLTTKTLTARTEKLSSGYRINRSADDAAGLSISEKMRRQIRGLTQASDNAQDGISFCQIADGALNEVSDMLNRAKELAIKAANETETDTDREYIQQEIDALSSEIDRIHSTSVFNERRVFTDAGYIASAKGKASSTASSQAAGFVKNDDGTETLSVKGFDVTLEFVDADGNRVDSVSAEYSGAVDSNGYNNSLASFAKDAIANAANKLAANFPNLFSAASTSGIKIGLQLTDKDVGGALAWATLRYGSNDVSTALQMSMTIDTKDYPIGAFDTYTDAQKADLAAVLAHEMTHLLMYDTHYSGMTGAYPSWLKEGVAQTSSGDNDWISNHLNTSSTDSQISNYLKNTSNREYGAGYVAAMYLGWMAGSNNNVDSSNIKSGLDTVLTSLAKGKSLSTVIYEISDGKYSNQSDFENKFFSNPTNDVIQFTKDLLTARGASGAGSLFGNLSDSEASVFAPGSLSTSSSNYELLTTTSEYKNIVGSAPLVLERGGGAPGAGGIGADSTEFALQVGSEAGQHIDVMQFNMSGNAIFGGAVLDVSTADKAEDSLAVIDDAAERVSTVRAYYGAIQNRLEHTVNNLDNIVENTTAAESLIRDTDMATEMVKYSNAQVLAQAGQSVLAQANQSNQGVLSLLG